MTQDFQFGQLVSQHGMDGKFVKYCTCGAALVGGFYYLNDGGLQHWDLVGEDSDWYVHKIPGSFFADRTSKSLVPWLSRAYHCPNREISADGLVLNKAVDSSREDVKHLESYRFLLLNDYYEGDKLNYSIFIPPKEVTYRSVAYDVPDGEYNAYVYHSTYGSDYLTISKITIKDKKAYLSTKTKHGLYARDGYYSRDVSPTLNKFVGSIYQDFLLSYYKSDQSDTSISYQLFGV